MGVGVERKEMGELGDQEAKRPRGQGVKGRQKSWVDKMVGLYTEGQSPGWRSLGYRVGYASHTL